MITVRVGRLGWIDVVALLDRGVPGCEILQPVVVDNGGRTVMSGNRHSNGPRRSVARAHDHERRDSWLLLDLILIIARRR